MADNTNRTFICSVLFLDIVEYSRRSVTEQLKLKEQFNTTLSEAISGVAVDDRIILDTGDGAAVSFLGDPEDAMFVALSMRDAIASQADEGPLLRVRFGINLGPVRLIKDINGQPNIIGDGINVAQRIMTFAEPGQILVSRSYYDIIARLSEDYANLFHYEGARTDKHVREHEVYAVGAAPRRLRSRTQPPPPRRVSAFKGFRLSQLAGGLAVDRKLLIIAPLAFVFIVGSAFAVRSYRKAEQAALVAVAPAARTARAEPRPAAAEEPRAGSAPVEERGVKPAAKAPPKEAAKKAQAQKASARAEPKPPTREELAARREKERQEAAAQKEKDKQEAAAKKEKEKQELAAKKEKERLELAALAERKAAKEREGPPGTLQLSVLPWGEVFIDGKKLGVSPPLHSVPITPGKHQVELRNASFPAHRQTLNVKPGESIIVSHRFR
jgi:class 3 adenylate cyclase